MDEEVEERIDSYLEMYGRILYKVSGKWPEHGIDIAGRVFEEISKDLRSEMIAEMRRRDYQVNRGERNCKIDGVLATRKQKETLHRFGVKNIRNKDLLLREIEVLNEKWQRE